MDQSEVFFVSMKIVFGIANSADPDEMLHHAASHYGQHCQFICLSILIITTSFFIVSP